MRLLILAVFLMLQAGVAVGQAKIAPDLALKNLKGQVIHLSNYRGKVVLINFWATWCPPCLAEMPELARLQKKHKDHSLQLIGIAYPSNRPRQVRRFVRRLRLNYPVLLGTWKIMRLFDVAEILPVTIVIDRGGQIRDRIIGILEPDEFKDKVSPLLDP